jgi:hypothetical protein
MFRPLIMVDRPRLKEDFSPSWCYQLVPSLLKIKKGKRLCPALTLLAATVLAATQELRPRLPVARAPCSRHGLQVPLPPVLAATAPPQGKEAIWHAPAFGTKLNQKKRKSYKCCHFHHQENTVAPLFLQKLWLKLSSRSTTTIAQTPNLHCHSSHD